MKASACIINNQFVFAIGGSDINRTFSDIEKYSNDNNSWQTIQIDGVREFPLTNNALSFQINPFLILIAGGETYRKDCFLLDVTEYSIKNVCDLPLGDMFPSPSAMMICNELLAFGELTESVIKFSINTN